MIVPGQGGFWLWILRTRSTCMAATRQSQRLTTQLIFDISLGSFWRYKKILIAVLLPNPALKSCLQSRGTRVSQQKKVQEKHEHFKIQMFLWKQWELEWVQILKSEGAWRPPWAMYLWVLWHILQILLIHPTSPVG